MSPDVDLMNRESSNQSVERTGAPSRSLAPFEYYNHDWFCVSSPPAPVAHFYRSAAQEHVSPFAV